MKKQAFNPFLPLKEYIPDGEAHVFGDRVYLFGSHDRENGETFCMLDYMGWSASVNDLSDWNCSGAIYSAKQDPRYDAQKMQYMYAPDVVRGNDEKFYLYYCLSGYNGKGCYSNPVSVAVCDIPDGKYSFLGYVQTPDGKPLMKYLCFDPAVINDNGVIRLYYGACFPFDEYRNRINGWIFDRVEAKMFGRTREEIKHAKGGIMGAFTVTLSDDMLTATSEPTRLFPTDTRVTGFAGHAFFEASSMRKIGDTYYFIYSSQNNHELCYATSSYPDRDFVFRGTIVSNGDIGFHDRKPNDRLNATGTNHGSIECIAGKWYVFYHRLTHVSDFSRQACAEPIKILSDGSIPQVEMTSCGLNNGPLRDTGCYPAPIACNITNGRMPHGTNKDKRKHFPCVTSCGGERFIGNIEDGTLMGFKYFAFAGGRYRIQTTVRGGSGSLTISTGEDEKEKLGTVMLKPSEAWQTVSLDCRIFKGKQALFFTYHGPDSVEMLNFMIKRTEE